MGYTHYWKFKKNDADAEFGKKFKTAVKLVKTCFARLPKEVEQEFCKWNDDYTEIIGTEKRLVPLKLKGWDGNGEPEITDTIVSFNGDPSHESCVIRNVGTDFNFCKTARKPYDVAVCITLICFHKVFGEDFTFSSDGDIEGGEEGWKLAKEITDEVFAETD